MGRKQLVIIIGLMTGHDLVKKLCGREPEIDKHVLCDCEASKHKRQGLFGEPKEDPEAYVNAQ